jgi:UDP-N-acetylglucosamine--N-acetylmuramyl-(pentapeptide) pyrophosphoryl-undecaprenol N-acetylglucosamine transferase
VTGGGSAGHVVPSLPVIEALQIKGWDVTYIGSDSGMEEDLVAPSAVRYFGVRTGKLRRYFAFANLTDALRVPFAVLQAIRILGCVKPDVVFSKGGFVALPVVFAAWLRKIPVVAHESDLSPGLANRLSLPFVSSFCVNFDATRLKGKRIVHTGTPIRSSLICGERDRGLVMAGFSGERPFLIVVGGSLGAQRLNEAVRGALSALTETFDILHVCGAGKLDEQLRDRRAYVQREFVHDGWGDLLAAADLVVSRAGANALYELLYLGKPNLLVPLPAAVSRGDQVENAAYARGEGFSVVVEEEDLSAEVLVESVKALYRDFDVWRERLAKFVVLDSTRLIVSELETALAAARH